MDEKSYPLTSLQIFLATIVADRSSNDVTLEPVLAKYSRPQPRTSNMRAVEGF
jgi:hypothetical protein